MRHERSCLYPNDWPRRDREALERCLRKCGLFDTSPAADWSSDTVDRRTRSYGTFLFFALVRRQLRGEVSPQPQGSLLADFIQDLKGRVELTTVAIVLTGMVALLKVLRPCEDRSELEAAAHYYNRIAAKLASDKRTMLPVGASDLYFAGMARIERFEKEATTDPLAGVASGDGLMMMMLAASPVRLKNLHASRDGVHVVKTAAGFYEWRFSPAEIKNSERVQAELPAGLTTLIDRWRYEVRPFLLRGNEHDAMWVTTRGNAMSRTTVYWRFCNATEEELGVRINPHAVRHIAATSIAVSMPESVRMIPFILNNDDRTAQEHYNLADQLSASQQYLHRLEVRRQQAMAALKVRR
jgi:integrase/recombinase XerD